MSTFWILLFQAGATTFQKNTVGALASPVEPPNCSPAPEVPGSSTPGMRYRISNTCGPGVSVLSGLPILATRNRSRPSQSS
ncbi:hypothetical protein MYFR107205_27575 [Mycolicibacterium frederiksbergense]